MAEARITGMQLDAAYLKCQENESIAPELQEAFEESQLADHLNDTLSSTFFDLIGNQGRNTTSVLVGIYKLGLIVGYVLGQQTVDFEHWMTAAGPAN